MSRSTESQSGWDLEHIETHQTADVDFTIDDFAGLPNDLDEYHRQKRFQHEVLTDEEVEALFTVIETAREYPNDAALVAAGEEAIDALIKKNQRLVMWVVSRYFCRKLTQDDLIQEGNIGLFIAICKYERGKGTKFPTYATYRIRQRVSLAILTSNDTFDFPQDAGGHIHRLARFIKDFKERYGHRPSKEEVLQGLKWKEDRYDNVAPFVQAALSLNRRIFDDDETAAEFGETLPESKQSIESLLEQKIIYQLVREALEELAQRYPTHSLILKLRFGFDENYEDKLTMKQIAEMLGVIPARVNELQKDAITKLQPILVKKGVIFPKQPRKLLY